MFYIYVLKSDLNNRYYVGSTQSINNRLQRHNSGYVRSTKTYRPWTLIYQEEFSTLSQARKRESQIKSWKSRARLEKLIQMAPSSSG